MSAIPYAIRRSDRARRARIVVDAGGVEVVVPRRMSLREVEPFVAEKEAWIQRTLRRYRTAALDGPRVDLRDGGSVPYLGRELALRVVVEPGRTRAHVALRAVTAPSDAGQLELAPPEQLTVKVGEPGQVRAALESWYRRRARAEVAPRLDAACARAGRSYSRLTIRAQRTRWASCSDGGSMSFNWRLLLAPAEVLDYVVEHEVAHLEVMGHSRRFWALVERRCPDYRRHESWLRRYGSALRL